MKENRKKLADLEMVTLPESFNPKVDSLKRFWSSE